MAQTTPTIHALDRVSVSAESKYVATVQTHQCAQSAHAHSACIEFSIEKHCPLEIIGKIAITKLYLEEILTK